MSLSSNYGDARMRRLGARLHKIYAQASRELTEKADSFFKQFEEKDAEMRALYEAGEITKHRWIAWRENQMMTGKRWNDLRDTMAQRMTSANQIAARYMNHELPAVYAHNWNDLMHDVESKVKGFSFDIVNERTIRKLSTSDKTLLPYKFVDGRRDVRWNSKRVNSQVLQGILQGEDASQLAKRLQSVTRMNEESALRNARTAVTSAQNKGRIDAMLKAEDDGVIMGKEWIATKDERTREAHLELDRTVVKADEPFENEIGQIMYPGDPDADPANTYNCRCTIAEVVLGFKPKEEVQEEEQVVEQEETADSFLNDVQNIAAESRDPVDFWMNMSPEQQAEFMERGLNYQEVFEQGQSLGVKKSEWAPVHGSLNDLPTHTEAYGDINLYADNTFAEGHMASAMETGSIAYNANGLGDSWKEILDHEVGHQVANMDSELQMHIAQNTGGIFGRYNQEKGFFDGLFGEYNAEESFATAFSVYLNNPVELESRYADAFKFMDTFVRNSPQLRKMAEAVEKQYLGRIR